MNQMPPVLKCDAKSCFFNRDDECRAGAITVGSDEPRCETYAKDAHHSDIAEQATVGACHVTDCRYNEEMLCNASGIQVGRHLDHADCETFEQR